MKSACRKLRTKDLCLDGAVFFRGRCQDGHDDDDEEIVLRLAGDLPLKSQWATDGTRTRNSQYHKLELYH